ncbi:diguanylate cyclase [Marinospirillum sp.]|uniref:diguanylate cyclase n=1 Tax=Marinospirillum sp. TaxID=2183934 RepID=UPI0028702500|nr:diguanylate cyclase [Marinospirillum sp.]MDR9468494.1 diguanylate cyclase [Marinospirillum sp.]
MKDKLKKSKLFRKTFASIVIGALAFTAISYWASVPWLRTTVEQQEEQTGRVILDNTYQLALSIQEDVQEWRRFALETRRRELSHILDLAENSLLQLEIQLRQQNLPPEEVEKQLMEALRHLQFGQEDYVYLLDIQQRILSHPLPQMHEQDFSAVGDDLGYLNLPQLIKKAQEEGEGFHRYRWTRLSGGELKEKLAHYKYLPERGWILVTGVYIDDVEAQVRQHKEKLIERLRQQIHQTRINETGYMFVFDGNKNMLIHPNPNIEGENVSGMINPLTQRSLAHELMAAADSKNNRIVYQWDRPSDPGNYVHDKISWVRYLPEFDWYMASSVYMSELQSTADTLTQRILIIATLLLLTTFTAAYFFLNRLIHPITCLARDASRVRDGDLTVRSDIQRNDEIGVLAATFNAMVARIKDQMEHMEQRVARRTAKLAETVNDLENRNHESSVFTRMNELLLSCRSEEEVFTITLQTCQAFFPEDSGCAYLADDQGQLHLVTQWGDIDSDQRLDDHLSCWSIRRGQSHQTQATQTKSLCPHCHQKDAISLCVPLQAEGQVTGIIRLNTPAGTREQNQKELARRERLLGTAVEHAALSVINLRLRERLHQESILDSLTGLHNRRYLEATLDREISRAERHQNQTGLIMVDVDHFKGFNDHYGHEMGDKVLSQVGHILRHCIRKEDTACRYGGEEFTLVIPETDTEGLATLAELVRSRIETQISQLLEGQIKEKVTVSLGTALYPLHAQDKTSLLKAADEALYQAKGLGRNQVATTQAS